MAATGNFLSRLVFVLLFHNVACLYEDQAGMFDWRQQHIGRVSQLYWEQQAGTSGGKRLLVASDKHVIASINTANGNIGWRKVFEEDVRGRVDSMLYNGDVLVTVLGGRRVGAWSPVTGNLNWEIYLPGDEQKSGQVSFTSEKTKGGIVVAMTTSGVYGLSLRDGSQKWDVALGDKDTFDRQHLLVHDGKVYIITIATGSEVKVVVTDLEGTTLWTKSVSSAWLDKATKCRTVQSQYLMCYSAAMESFQVLNLQDPISFIATSVQDLGLGKERLEDDNWFGCFSSTTNGIIVKLAMDHYALLSLAGSGHVSVKKNLPGSLSVAMVTYDDRDYILSVERSGHEELTLTGHDVNTGEELTELGHKIHYATHNGLPVEVSGLLARKKDGKMAYKLAMLSQDSSLQVIHKNGKVAWRREESIAYSVAVEMVDLPVSENQAKFEDEFGSHEDNILTMFMKRIKTQLSQLQTFITQQIERLRGLKHHHAPMYEEDDDDDDDDLLRDDFSLNKMIVLVTSVGKVIGMKSWNGHIAWQHYIPGLVPFTRFGREKLLLYTQRTTAHFPHPPQCVVVGRNKITGRGHLFAFNPITGEPVGNMVDGGQHLDFNIVQSFMLGEMDSQFLKGIVMVDEALKIHTYPESIQTSVREHASSLFLYIASPETGVINGYRVASRDNQLFAESVWNINLQKKQQTITNIVGKKSNEHVHSQGRVLGDRSVLYKYLNPNIILVTAEGEEAGTSQTKGFNFINLYMIDVVTGHIVFHGSHRRSKGPVHVVHAENWAVYNYYNMKQRRHEMAVLEMFEGKEQSNSTAFSSFTAPTQPLVMRQSFIFPMPLYTMASTLTEKGITSKNIIVALKTGGLFSLPKAFLDPRRPLMPTQETMEEGTLPYIPELPVHTEGIINYNQTVHHVRGIHTAPAGLESTSLVLSYGLDLFYTRVQPSKMFDVLKEDFEYWVIACVLGVMSLVSVISQKLAARKALQKAWK